MIDYMKKCIVLCADDYGQAPAISQGILALLKMARLSAVSCLVTTPYWPEHAKWLQPFQSNIDIGLHFNLTLDKSSLGSLMAKSMIRQLDAGLIAAELNTQIDAFLTATGRLPDFIDGHQHVHQFPIIRDALLKVYLERFPDKKPYIRVAQFSSYYLSLKKAIVQLMGAHALIKRLDENKIKYNHSFSGMYSFTNASKYPALFPSFLAEIGAGGLIMCHPGMPSPGPTDPISMARFLEYQYLSSLRFKMDCDTNEIAIMRFEDCIAK